MSRFRFAAIGAAIAFTAATVIAAPAHAAPAAPSAVNPTSVRLMVQQTVAQAGHAARWKRQGFVPKDWRLVEVVPLQVESNSGAGTKLDDFTSWIVAVGLVWQRPNGDKALHTLVVNWDDGKRSGKKYFDDAPLVSNSFTGPEHMLPWAIKRASEFLTKDTGEGLDVIEGITVINNGMRTIEQPVSNLRAFWVFLLPNGKSVCVNDKSGGAYYQTDIDIPGFPKWSICARP